MTRRARTKMEKMGRWFTLALVVAAMGTAAFIYARWLYREHRCNRLIEDIATRQDVDKFLIKAVIRRESKFDPFAYGRAGEIGLMQVTPGAGRDWARAMGRQDFQPEQLWDPRTNIEAGSWYLGRAMRRWRERDDPIPFALAEYNAGLGNVQRWLPRGRATTAEEFIAAITYPGVREYVTTVRGFHEHYRQRGAL